MKTTSGSFLENQASPNSAYYAKKESDVDSIFLAGFLVVEWGVLGSLLATLPRIPTRWILTLLPPL